ncbi:hypothetical protein [Streptomyces sp. NBC_00147]|uniref:hypothetical protein n=1 Tax=Streptomyces sp. NBC_00147 TaxID=2975667 RepID=UPI00325229A2
MTDLSLADVTERWKSASPQERLWHRRDLLKVADLLDAAIPALGGEITLLRARALTLARDLTFASSLVSGLAPDPFPPADLARGLDVEIARAHERARDFARAPSRENAHALIRAIDVARERARGRGRARALNVALARARAIARAFERELDRGSARPLTHTHDLNVDLGLERESALGHIRRFARELNRALENALELALNRANTRRQVHSLEFASAVYEARNFDLSLAFAPDLARDLIEARNNLTDAANSFVGADLTTVDIVEVNLAGVRWNSATQWPTPEWTQRIRRASVEDPPGSGVFVVLPEEGHHFADLGSLAPTS